MHDNPLPTPLVLLWLALPGVWFAGQSVARRATDDRVSAAFLAPGLSLAFWILAVHITGLMTGSFVFGLVGGTVFLSLIGVASFLNTRRNPSRPAPRKGPPWPMWILGAIGAFGIVARLAFGGMWHDEGGMNGHMANIAQMQNGTYPPRFLPFVEHELRYHYAFDIVSAATTALARLRIDDAIDVVSIALWFYCFCVLWVLGDRLLGRGRGFLTATMALFGGGAAPIFFFLWPPPTSLLMASIVPVDLQYINPPNLSYFFQHPWALGIVFLSAFLLLFGERRPRSSFAHFAALGALLVALSLSQIVCFVGLLAAAPAAAMLEGGLTHWRRAAKMTAVSFVALVVASQLHGFFAPSYDPQAGFGILLGTDATLKWQLVTFGALLPLGVLGLIVHRAGGRMRALPALLAAGSILVLNLFRYAHTTDIFKFATLGSIALAILSSYVIAHAFAIRPRALGAALGMLGFASVTLAGFEFAYVVIVNTSEPTLQYYFPRKALDISLDDSLALSFLRKHVSRRELVMREGPPAAMATYAPWGGIVGPFPANQARQHGASPKDMNRWAPLLRSMPPDVDLYLAKGIAWIVLVDENPQKNARLRELVSLWEGTKRASVVASFGKRHVVRLLPMDSPNDKNR